MLTYVILAKFTEKGIAGIKESPDRARAFVNAKGAEFGLNVKTTLWLLGEYDLLIIADVPNEVMGTAAVVSLAKAGNLKTSNARLYGRRDERDFGQSLLMGAATDRFNYWTRYAEQRRQRRAQASASSVL
jgi:uncharacterized protein with GYD domain